MAGRLQGETEAVVAVIATTVALATAKWTVFRIAYGRWQAADREAAGAVQEAHRGVATALAGRAFEVELTLLADLRAASAGSRFRIAAILTRTREAGWRPP